MDNGEHERFKAKRSNEEIVMLGLVSPLAEQERFVHYQRRQRRLPYPIPLVASEPTSPVARVEQEEPEIIMAELKSMVQLLHTNGQFTGLSHEDPTVHIQNFLEISAKRWLNSELANSITTWNDLAQKFLIRLFPSGKIAKLRSDILSFRQKVGENLYQVWDRFKSMLMSCPHHHQSNEVLVHTFIEGLESNTKILLDSVVGGQALEKTYAELFTLLNRISQGNPEWNGGGVKPVIQKTVGMLEVDVVTALTAQIAAMQNMMITHFNNLALGQQPAQEMPNEEEASKIMGTLITQVGATTRTFLGVKIKIRVKAKISIDPKEMHKGTNHRPNGSNRISNLVT
ncbi:hypothetical protein KY284_012912 [Solanum tuberosum]|nr:hypothetical protein KY284_012912 [Solanum tuberosum]